ncbi:hypothetical protein GTA08_BOTSDO11942 [Neofusicoccum parvum]|uniref:Uncharacterized protein n=1 Tax=Neofusicoccum parvum TaxID=310453 RepID=A0ACB5S976_9PEZI|nr:hypothetical protein GTA08_BOTSDO11942 [Neofusicoccum parvum]
MILDIKEAAEPAKEPTICGLRKNTFWIVLSFVLLMIIAVAVGGGVGGSLANKKSKDSTSTTSDNTSSNSSSSETTATVIPLLSNTSLASINWTDADGTSNYHVFYQLSTGALAQSAWNTSTRTWTTHPVAPASPLIKNGTPIAASLYWHSASRRSYQIYWLDPSNAVRGLLSNNAPLGPFAPSSIDGRYTAGPGSSLASYGRACPDCLDANAVAFVDADDRLRLAVNTPWALTAADAAVEVASGGAVALAPVAASAGPRRLALFVGAGETGNLTRVLWDGEAWASETLPTALERDAAVAAFAYGYNGTEGFSMQAVSSKAEGADGVGVTAFDQGADAWNSSADAGTGGTSMQSIAAGSALAANQAGRVYGFVGNGSLGEWVWDSGNGYSFNGWVNTTVVS